MKYIANIVTNQKIDVGLFFNIVSDITLIDNSIPTLIIGWDNVKNMFPDQNILCSHISDDISWTFSKREKRYKYENDLKCFIENVINNINNKANYRFFNYIVSTDKKQKDFLSYVNKGNCSIYHNSKFLYIYNFIDEITIGISLKDLSYIGINIKDFIKSLNKNNNNVIFDNLNFIDDKSFNIVRDNVKISAYLYYLKHHDIYKEKSYND